jgi:hypothetical protein
MKQEMLRGCVPENTYQELHCLQRKRRKKILKMSERSESKRIGAKQHKNSGRNTHKGDATWRNFTVDFKEYPKGITVNKDIWAKAVTDAIRNGNDPAIFLVLGEGNAKVRLAVIEVEMLEQLTEGYENDTAK